MCVSSSQTQYAAKHMRKLWLWMTCQSINLKAALFSPFFLSTPTILLHLSFYERSKKIATFKKDKMWFVVEIWVSLEKRHKTKQINGKKERGIQALATKTTLFWVWMLKVIAKIAGWAEVNDNQYSFEIYFSCLT